MNHEHKEEIAKWLRQLRGDNPTIAVRRLHECLKKHDMYPEDLILTPLSEQQASATLEKEIICLRSKISRREKEAADLKAKLDRTVRNARRSRQGHVLMKHIWQDESEYQQYLEYKEHNPEAVAGDK